MTLSIAGGWYEEVCCEPHWHEFYGPGGRAAAALSGRTSPVVLHTFCPPNLHPKLEYFAQAFGFAVRLKETTTATPRFSYLHWLRTPDIYPENEHGQKLPVLNVDAELVLRFGFYEGDAIVNAKRAVYDPQSSPERIASYHSNGSTADELVIVCNYSEGSALTREQSPANILANLLQIKGVVGVALKGGWGGVWVADKSRQELVKPTPTRNVHKIGSGDVFSAEFSYGWMAMGLDIVAAASRASNQVAAYVDSASLPVPDVPSIRAPSPKLPELDGKNKKYDVYLAAPFFNHAQLSLVEEMAAILRTAGLVVFSPYHDVGYGHIASVAKQDLEALRASRTVVACLDGYDPGTIFEVGYARALDIPALLYSHNLAELHSTMFLGSGCEVARDFTSAVYRTVWWAKGT